jgi:hypothetical protein
VTYQHLGGRIQKTSGSLTPDTVTINELSFSLEPSLYDQPRIIINVVGQLGSNPDDTFYLQTSVTQRELNVGP